MVSELLAEESVIDQTRTTFGIRTIAWDADDDFVLNGWTAKLNGVCMGKTTGYRFARLDANPFVAGSCRTMFFAKCSPVNESKLKLIE